jgi:hypothetical protein
LNIHAKAAKHGHGLFLLTNHGREHGKDRAEAKPPYGYVRAAEKEMPWISLRKSFHYRIQENKRPWIQLFPLAPAIWPGS